MSTLGESMGLALGLVARADAQVLGIMGLSLRVSGLACVIGAVLGGALGAALAFGRWPGRAPLVWLLNTLLAVPSVVVGLGVYLLLSRAGPLGPLGILFTPAAMVVAQSLLVVPLVAALTRRLLLDAQAEGGEQLQSLGAGPGQRTLLLLLHERLAVLTIALTAFGRAVSEVGAVMIVGGNIDGVTRVMTTAIALETSKGDLALALALGLVLLGVVGLINGGIAALQWQAARSEAGVAAEAVGAAATAAPPASAPASPPSALASPATPPPLAPIAPAPAPPAVLLRLHDTRVRLGGFEALRGVSLQLVRGERLALVGANGSGKTTLLRLLHGLLDGQRPAALTAGRIERLPLQPEGRLPRAAMLFQRPFLLRLSVQANVAVGLALAGVPRAQRPARVAQALAQVGLQAHARRPARALSGGQQQRLALARAWALQPELLLLDEPTASLDPAAKREIEALIEAVAAAGVTLVMSTHNLGQVKRLASRVLCLEAGHVAADLPVATFFSATLPPEAAAFVRGELPWH